MENKRISIKEFENTIIPDGWARCFNEACGQHYSCVRFKAGEALSKDQTEGCSVYPNAVKKDGVCKYYKAYDHTHSMGIQKDNGEHKGY